MSKRISRRISSTNNRNRGSARRLDHKTGAREAGLHRRTALGRAELHRRTRVGKTSPHRKTGTGRTRTTGTDRLPASHSNLSWTQSRESADDEVECALHGEPILLGCHCHILCVSDAVFHFPFRHEGMDLEERENIVPCSPAYRATTDSHNCVKYGRTPVSRAGSVLDRAGLEIQEASNRRRPAVRGNYMSVPLEPLHCRHEAHGISGR